MIKINIKVLNTDTLEETEFNRTFARDEDSIAFLLEIHDRKMQDVFDYLLEGEYDANVILENSDAVLTYPNVPYTKARPFYDVCSQNNFQMHDIKIIHA